MQGISFLSIKEYALQPPLEVEIEYFLVDQVASGPNF
jgi:hypothetical protein